MIGRAFLRKLSQRMNKQTHSIDLQIITRNVGQHPLVVLTDAGPALDASLGEVFPSTTSMHCTIRSDDVRDFCTRIRSKPYPLTLRTNHKVCFPNVFCAISP